MAKSIPKRIESTPRQGYQRIGRACISSSLAITVTFGRRLRLGLFSSLDCMRFSNNSEIMHPFVICPGYTTVGCPLALTFPLVCVVLPLSTSCSLCCVVGSTLRLRTPRSTFSSKAILP